MAAVIICSDFKPPKIKSVTVPTEALVIVLSCDSQLPSMFLAWQRACAWECLAVYVECIATEPLEKLEELWKSPHFFLIFQLLLRHHCNNENSPCPTGAYYMRRGLGTEVLPYRSISTPHLLMKVMRLPGSITSSEAHNLAWSLTTGDQPTAFCSPASHHEFFPNVSKFWATFIIHATSSTPTHHQGLTSICK